MSTLRYKWNATVGNSQEIWNKLKANRCGSFLFIWLNNLSCLTAQVFRAVKPHRTSTFSESRIPRKRVTFFMNDMKLSVFVKGKSIFNTGIDCFCETTAIYYFSMELITLSSCWKWTHQVCASCFHLFSFHVYAKSFQIIKNVTHTHTFAPKLHNLLLPLEYVHEYPFNASIQSNFVYVLGNKTYVCSFMVCTSENRHGYRPQGNIEHLFCSKMFPRMYCINILSIEWKEHTILLFKRIIYVIVVKGNHNKNVTHFFAKQMLFISTNRKRIELFWIIDCLKDCVNI